jgi:hypothetical protein
MHKNRFLWCLGIIGRLNDQNPTGFTSSRLLLSLFPPPPRSKNTPAPENSSYLVPDHQAFSCGRRSIVCNLVSPIQQTPFDLEQTNIEKRRST